MGILDNVMKEVSQIISLLAVPDVFLLIVTFLHSIKFPKY